MISELEHIAIEMIKKEAWRDKKYWTKFKRASAICGTIWTYLTNVWVLEGKKNGWVGRGQRTEVFEENIGQKFSKLVKT